MVGAVGFAADVKDVLVLLPRAGVIPHLSKSTAQIRCHLHPARKSGIASQSSSSSQEKAA